LDYFYGGFPRKKPIGKEVHSEIVFDTEKSRGPNTGNFSDTNKGEPMDKYQIESARDRMRILKQTAQDNRDTAAKLEEQRIHELWLGTSFQFASMIPDKSVVKHLSFTDALTGNKPDQTKEPSCTTTANILLPDMFPIQLWLYKDPEGEYVWGLGGYRYIVPGIHLDGLTLRVIYYPTPDPSKGVCIEGTWYDDSKKYSAVYTDDFEIAIGFAVDYYQTWQLMKESSQLTGIAPDIFYS